MEKVREHISFSGRVQGLCFRYKATHLASHYGLTGWVRNEYDGTLTGEFQGLAAEIDLVLQGLVRDHRIDIDGLERRRIPLAMEERGFSIRR